jgi:hypothetical protein
MIVNWRRSGCADGGSDSSGADCSLPDIATFCAPQFTQNRFLGAFLTPQAWHAQGSGSPQSPQNFWPLATRV